MVRCSLTGATNDYDYMTVKVVTGTDSTGVSERVYTQAGTTVADARVVVLMVEYGAGDNTTLGEDEVTVTLNRSNDGTVRVFSTIYQPFPMSSIEV